MAKVCANVFRKSSHCTQGSCVEVALLKDGSIAVRNSANPDPRQTFTPAEWSAFVRGVKSGEFDFDLPGLD